MAVALAVAWLPGRRHAASEVLPDPSFAPLKPKPSATASAPDRPFEPAAPTHDDKKIAPERK